MSSYLNDILLICTMFRRFSSNFETTYLYPLLLKNLHDYLVWFFFLCMHIHFFFSVLRILSLYSYIFHYNMPRYGFKNKTKYSLTFFKLKFFGHSSGPFSVKLLKISLIHFVCVLKYFSYLHLFSFFCLIGLGISPLHHLPFLLLVSFIVSFLSFRNYLFLFGNARS